MYSSTPTRDDQTDPDFADASKRAHHAEVVAKIIERERTRRSVADVGWPDRVNTAMALFEQGIIGFPYAGDDRRQRRSDRDRRGPATSSNRPWSRSVSRSLSADRPTLDEAMAGSKGIGLPIIIAPRNILGGRGTVIPPRQQPSSNCVLRGLAASPDRGDPDREGASPAGRNTRWR